MRNGTHCSATSYRRVIESDGVCEAGGPSPFFFVCSVALLRANLGPRIIIYHDYVLQDCHRKIGIAPFWFRYYLVQSLLNNRRPSLIPTSPESLQSSIPVRP
jgi:hypothetical protein